VGLVVASLASAGVVAALPIPAHAASPIKITRVYVNSPGSDTGENDSLNAEYIRIKNTGTTNRSLTGWTVRDESSHVYTFGTFTLKAGYSVTVRTGKGTNTASTRYWQKTWYVWNNSGDSARLRNASGTAIDSCSWGTASSYVTC
jgi:hypothetical protein